MEPLSTIVKWEGLGLCSCLVLDRYFSMVHIFPIYNANFSLNFFFLCLEYYLLLMSIKSILVLSYPLSLCRKTSANFPLNCYPVFKGKVAITCFTFGHKLHFRQSFRRKKHFLFCSKTLQLLDPLLLLGPVTNPPLSVKSMGPNMDAEDMGIAKKLLFHARLLVQRPVGESAEWQVNGILSSG